ncbi:glycoside hydrolase family 3 N-terminal domain-containing protein [Agathobacter ruminis]|uniref:beta-glucosidase n=1 Tax=Agathobacter ruminis TaxID=1712665 RepID=A0A2G3DYX5_9FIRM|nr:glycoside hydrolase family 3 N-terminal domain-containing protein [Agathobacter ruminis]MDC7302342.1 glycoside hydrolase family 3 C-terminal domain-containing protein [Agathobacter ruminis]PHU36242.1 glycosyl hydrolase [Agathobacter ruminis]
MKLEKTAEAFVEELLGKMTLEEKIGQMNQASVSLVGGFDVPFEELIEMVTDGRVSQEKFEELMRTSERDYHEDDIRAGLVGSVMCQDPEKVNELQHIAVEETRLGIPLLIGLDVIHGFRSIYPIALAEACAFDENLFERTARMATKESRAKGVNWHFAPMLDVARDARWGRVSEGPGEDPYLGSLFARAKVRGLQNDRSCTDNYVAACLKHYVAYGACEAGRDYNTTTMSPSILRNVYLPSFKAAVDEGAMTVMASFNDLNGVPCTVNQYTLRQILKGEYQFDGLVVSDANAIRECVIHGIAADNADAGRQAAIAGLDIDMGTNIYRNHLADSVREGLVDESVIDDAVRRILRVKKWLGLFEHPYVPEELMHRYDTLPAEHVELAREAAEKSIVLLKNDDHVLPLKKDTKIALVGALADMPEEVVGSWALSWQPEDCVSLKMGLENKKANFEYFRCAGPEGDYNEDEVAQAIAYGEVIVALVGETTAMSGEAASRADITIPGQQRRLLEALQASGKPVVVLLQNGRPLALDWEKEHCPTLVETWHLGIQMGNAVANVLFGEKVPEGKLSVTMPLMTGQCPVYYNHPNTGRPGTRGKFTSRYLDAGHEIAFVFGHGLSYTTFEYHDLQVKDCGDKFEVSVSLKNTGDCKATETVQMYLQDVTASLVRPVKELKGFQKVTLSAGQRTKVMLELDKTQMGFYNNSEEYVREDGLFRIYVGGSSGDCLCEEITVQF